MAGLQRTFLVSLTSLIGLLFLALPQSSGVATSNAPRMQETLPSEELTLQALRARRLALIRQLAQYNPTGPYIVVDTARNRLFVKRKDEILLAATASTGSGTILDKPGQSDAQWVFDTPRGEFAVQSKLINPVWVKPDWAFLEEGLDVPSDPAERVEAGVLGEYALGFGKGYFIHGTLYTRLLGKNVTHGCIRLSDDDLKAVYQLAKIGTPIMIF
ncbi:MAG TPA: L,D-transpeptidase [Nitrospiraceae bacterium]|jgi:L,D-transpeptidase YbiS|nr:L,D-transpeptidase [Nitrospiraceae bacterium]